MAKKALIYASTRRLAQFQRIRNRGVGSEKDGGGASADEGLVAKRGIPVQRHTCALDLLISVTFLFIMGRLPSRKPQPPPHHQSHFPKAPNPAPPLTHSNPNADCHIWFHFEPFGMRWYKPLRRILCACVIVLALTH